MKTNIAPLPLWRSILFVPAHVDRFVKAAQTRGADAIQLDLEDSVPLDAKVEARSLLKQGIEHLSAQDVDIIVRVNRDLASCVKDLDVAITPGVSAICLPKVMGPEHIRLIDEAITELETKRNMPIGEIRIIALIETVEAILSVESLAGASPRLSGLAIGSEDLSLDGGFEPTSENLVGLCQRIMLAARVANIRSYGFPGSIADYNDMEQFESLIRKAKSMGFSGAFCIHPKQVEAINEVYNASESEIRQARKVIDAYELAVKSNLGAVEVDGRMIDKPVVERARELLKANRLS